MQASKRIYCGFLLLIVLGGMGKIQAAGDFDSFLKPLFAAKCFKCHGGGKKIKGKVNLKEILTEMGLSLGMKLHNFPRVREEE